MEQVSTALQRGDWVGICVAVVIGGGTVIAILWRAFHNEKQRADSTMEIIKGNAEAMKDLADQIRASVSLSTHTNERLLQALVDNLKK